MNDIKVSEYFLGFNKISTFFSIESDNDTNPKKNVTFGVEKWLKQMTNTRSTNYEKIEKLQVCFKICRHAAYKKKIE